MDNPLFPHVMFWCADGQDIKYLTPNAYTVWDRADEIVGYIRRYVDTKGCARWAAYDGRTGEYTFGHEDSNLFETTREAAAWLFMDEYGA